MKKLNNKGFTLVELLAVIIILAIVVGITIPAITSTTSNAKKRAFQTAADTCADWIERQYMLYVVDNNDSSINSAIKNSLNTTGSAVKMNAAMVTACGLKTANVVATGTGDDSKFIISSTGRVCLLLKATDNGDYNKSGTKDANGAAQTNSQYVVGGTCGTNFAAFD